MGIPGADATAAMVLKAECEMDLDTGCCCAFFWELEGVEGDGEAVEESERICCNDCRCTTWKAMGRGGRSGIKNIKDYLVVAAGAGDSRTILSSRVDAVRPAQALLLSVP